jgi:hypothetical protein
MIVDGAALGAGRAATVRGADALLSTACPTQEVAAIKVASPRAIRACMSPLDD